MQLPPTRLRSHVGSLFWPGTRSIFHTPSNDFALLLLPSAYTHYLRDEVITPKFHVVLAAGALMKAYLIQMPKFYIEFIFESNAQDYFATALSACLNCFHAHFIASCIFRTYASTISFTYSPAAIFMLISVLRSILFRSPVLPWLIERVL